jgi:hypothetical protein
LRGTECRHSEIASLSEEQGFGRLVLASDLMHFGPKPPFKAAINAAMQLHQTSYSCSGQHF